MSNVKLKTVGIDTLNKDSLHCYVINNTKSNFNFQYYDEANQPKIITVSETFIPQDLCAETTAELLMKTSSFRRALSTGILTLVSEDSAREFLSDPSSQKEFERIQSKKGAVSLALRYNKDDQSDAKQLDNTVSATMTDMDEVSDAVRDTLIREDIDNEKKLRILESKEKNGDLTSGDLDYIIAAAPTDANSIVQWAVNMKSKREGLFTSI